MHPYLINSIISVLNTSNHKQQVYILLKQLQISVNIDSSLLHHGGHDMKDFAKKVTSTLLKSHSHYNIASP